MNPVGGSAVASGTFGAGPIVFVLLWAVVGAAAGWVMRWGSVRLARLEGLEP